MRVSMRTCANILVDVRSRVDAHVHELTSEYNQSWIVAAVAGLPFFREHGRRTEFHHMLMSSPSLVFVYTNVRKNRTHSISNSPPLKEEATIKACLPSA